MEEKLNAEVDRLQFLCDEREAEVIKAAEIGKALLEKNNDLQLYMDELVQKHSKKVEDFQQQIYNLERNIESKHCTENWYKEELSQLRQSSTQELEKLQEQLEGEKHQQVSKQQKQIYELHSDLEQSQKNEEQLRDQIENLKELLQQQMNQTCVETASQSVAGLEVNDLQQEVLELQNEVTNLKRQGIEERSEAMKFKTETEMLQQKLLQKDHELQEMQSQAASYCSAVERARMEIMELKAEIEGMRMETQTHSTKGNSLFSEVEDRRVEVEKKIITLKVQVDTMKQKYEMEKQQHEKLKMQLMVLLQVSRGNVDNDRMSQLEAKLSQERHENSELKNKIYQLEQKQKNESEKFSEIIGEMSVGSVTDTKQKKVDGGYAKYLVTLLKTKDNEINSLKQEMKSLDMMALEAKNEAFKLQHKVYDAESERNKIQNQNLKLKLKMEEMMVKYDPESLKNRQKATVKKIEKIPLAEIKEFHCKSDTSMQERSDKPSNVSVMATTKTKENMWSGEEESLTVKKKQRTISIADSVTVLDEEGQIKKEQLSEADKNKMERSSGQKPPKGRRMQNVKELKCDNTNDCNTQ